MGLLSHRISRDELKAGDHIYTWRTAYIYSHHGIYVGDEKVIHFTRGRGIETGTGTFLDKFIEISIPNHGGRGDSPCPKCGDQSILDGVISSCIDCFLAEGNLCLFEYNVSKSMFLAKPRGGTCTIAPSDPCDDVISRAKFLLLRNGFGAYNLFENNCEDFATYCKTGFVVTSKIKFGSSGQATTASVARDVLPWTLSLFGAVKSGGKAASVVTSALGYVCTGFGGFALAGYTKYSIDRLLSDVGVRNDVSKVPVERLVAIIEVMEGRSDNDNNDIVSLTTLLWMFDE